MSVCTEKKNFWAWILIIPGDMIHSTTPNKHDEDRIVLGLNFFTKGVFGLDDNYGKLEL